MNSKTLWVAVVFGVVWSAIVLVFDAFVGVPTVRQWMTVSHPSTEGTVISSEIVRRADDDGPGTHSLSVRYSYQVDGQDYTGTRLRHLAAVSADPSQAQALAAAMTEGTKVQVFYRPGNPADAVLLTGLAAHERVLLLVMTPFNAVMIGMWGLLAARLRRARFAPTAGGVRIISEPGATRVRLNVRSPFHVGMGAIVVLAFGSLFWVGPGADSTHPNLGFLGRNWGILLAAGLAAGLWQFLRNRSGKGDLLILEQSTELDLPPVPGRPGRRRVAFGDVAAVSVEVLEKTSSDDTQMYVPTLHLRSEGSPSEPLVRWSSAEKAIEFAAWLRVRLQLR